MADEPLTPTSAPESAAAEPKTPETAPELPLSPPSEPTEAKAEAKEPAETKETLLEAVTKAVKPPVEDGEERETKPEAPTEAAPSERKGPDLTKDPSPEELAGYKKDTRERIQQLLSERNTFRSEADVTRTLRDFLVTNDIAREDFQLTLDLAAAMRRGDYRSFLEGVGPYVQLATQALGITLPPDLAGEVQSGRVSFDAAAQISRERYARALSDQRATRATQVLTSQHTHQQAAQLSQSIEQSVTAWEAGVRQSDPDYARKEPTVRNFLWAVVQEKGTPQTPEQAVEIAREAYSRATETMRSFAPAPRPTRATPSSVNRAAAPLARPEPKSMMEAVVQGLERHRARQ
jgi:hypothetical protein